jgi:hypothetical protein
MAASLDSYRENRHAPIVTVFFCGFTMLEEPPLRYLLLRRVDEQNLTYAVRTSQMHPELGRTTTKGVAVGSAHVFSCAKAHLASDESWR